MNTAIILITLIFANLIISNNAESLENDSEIGLKKNNGVLDVAEKIIQSLLHDDDSDKFITDLKIYFEKEIIPKIMDMAESLIKDIIKDQNEDEQFLQSEAFIDMFLKTFHEHLITFFGVENN